MLVEGTLLGIFEQINIAFGLKAFLLLFLLFNTVFAVVIYRQIQLMGRTVYTSLVPFLKFIAVLYIGACLGVLFIVGGSF